MSPPGFFILLSFCFLLLPSSKVMSKVPPHVQEKFASEIISLKNLNIKIIAPSAGVSQQTWEKVRNLLGETCIDFTIFNTGGSEEQVFSNACKKSEDLDRALVSNSEILWTIRGGYGLDKVMPFILKKDYSHLPPKTIIGYSDTTALQNYFSQKYGWKNISACNFQQTMNAEKSLESRRRILTYIQGKTQDLVLPDLRPLNPSAQKSVSIKGKTGGGNMSIIQTSIGTKWQLIGSEKILFLEDIGVHGYSLDRLLAHLKNSGILKKAKALIFGDFNERDQKILQHFASQSNIPIFQTDYFGHGNINFPIGINFDGEIYRDKKDPFFTLKMK